MNLKSFNIKVDVYDPIVNSNEVKKNYDLQIQIKMPKKGKYDLVVISSFT